MVDFLKLNIQNERPLILFLEFYKKKEKQKNHCKIGQLDFRFVKELPNTTTYIKYIASYTQTHTFP